MPNGRPGDHPLTDIFQHKLETYGPEADRLMRLIGEMMDWEDLSTWWDRELTGGKSPDEILRRVREKYSELLGEREAPGNPGQEPLEG